MLSPELRSLLFSTATARDVALVMRDVEESVLMEIRGDIMVLQSGYRYACMWLRRKFAQAETQLEGIAGSLFRTQFMERAKSYSDEAPKLFAKHDWRKNPHARLLASRVLGINVDLPGFEDIHPGLRAPLYDLVHRRPARFLREPLTGSQYAAITERLESALKLRFVTLKYVRKVVFTEDPAMERARRIPIYRKSLRIIEDTFIKDDQQRKGPYASKVYCPELDVTFNSAREAAGYIQTMFGNHVDPADIRNCIRRGTKRGQQFTWRKVRCEAGEQQACRPTGRERPVECVEPPIRFSTIVGAAAYAKCSPNSLSEAIDSGESVNGLYFKWAESSSLPAGVQVRTLFNMEMAS